MDSWVETESGNRISRHAVLNGTKKIFISGNCTISENCTLNGDAVTGSDLPVISIGKYCFLEAGSCIQPPKLPSKSEDDKHLSVTIGNYSSVGQDSHVEAATIGNRVKIGARCHIGELSVINDCCIIEDDCFVPRRAVIPPFTRVSGKPGAGYLMESISEAFRKTLESEARIRHHLGK